MPITYETESTAAHFLAKRSTKNMDKNSSDFTNSYNAPNKQLTLEELDRISEQCAAFFSQNLNKKQLGDFIEI